MSGFKSLLVLLVGSTVLMGAGPVTDPAKEKAVKAAIEDFRKELPKQLHAGTLADVTGSFSGPTACGKTYDAAEVLTKGIPIAISGSGSVAAGKPGATFHLYVKIVDDKGDVLRESSSSNACQSGNSTDFGYVHKIQKCYCDAAKLTVTIALGSIDATGNFILHQYKECDITITPATPPPAAKNSGGC